VISSLAETRESPICWKYCAMLPGESPGNEPAFFEIAATLIPLLLFGGVVIERVRPSAIQGSSKAQLPVSLAIMLFGALALGAEALAIEAAVIGKGSAVSRVTVALFLVAGMTSVVVAIAAPWLSRLKKADRTSYWLVVLSSVPLLLVVSTAALAILVDGTNVASNKERFSSYNSSLIENSAEQNALSRTLDSFWLEKNRLEGRLMIATGHGDTVAERALENELEKLGLKTEVTEELQRTLFNKGVNLERGMIGEP
jgi:hypothetical protein